VRGGHSIPLSVLGLCVDCEVGFDIQECGGRCPKCDTANGWMLIPLAERITTEREEVDKPT
jgi:hypothetical protein